MHEKYYKIGEVVEILGIEAHTLRYLESTLHLKIRRNGRGERLYSEADLELLQLIHKLKTENHLNTHAIRMALDHLEKKEEPLLPPMELPQKSPFPGNAENFIALLAAQNRELMSQNQKVLQHLEHLEEMVQQQEQRQKEQLDQLFKLWQPGKSPQVSRWWKKRNS